MTPRCTCRRVNCGVRGGGLGRGESERSNGVRVIVTQPGAHAPARARVEDGDCAREFVVVEQGQRNLAFQAGTRSGTESRFLGEPTVGGKGQGKGRPGGDQGRSPSTRTSPRHCALGRPRSRLSRSTIGSRGSPMFGAFEGPRPELAKSRRNLRTRQRCRPLISMEQIGRRNWRRCYLPRASMRSSLGEICVG